MRSLYKVFEPWDEGHEDFWRWAEGGLIETLDGAQSRVSATKPNVGRSYTPLAAPATLRLPLRRLRRRLRLDSAYIIEFCRVR